MTGSVVVSGAGLFCPCGDLGVCIQERTGPCVKRHAPPLLRSRCVLIAGVFLYLDAVPNAAATIVGVVRATEIRVEPEVDRPTGVDRVGKGAQVHAGDVLARLSAVELTAQADQARAALASAVANRNNVYAGVRQEQVYSLKAESPRPPPGSTMCRRN